MSGNILNERKSDLRIPIIIFIIVILIVLVLYSQGNLPFFTKEKIAEIDDNDENQEAPEKHLNQTDVEESGSNVILIKYVTYKTDDGSVLEVRGYLGVKTEYYDNFLKDLTISVQNIPENETTTSKSVYRKEYKGYVIVSFKVHLKKEDSINVNKLKMQVLYKNSSTMFVLDLSKNVKVVKSDYTVELQYSIPKLVQAPVKISITIDVISKYDKQAEIVLKDIVTHYKETNIVMRGEFQYYMQAVDYEVRGNSITIFYVSPSIVQSGVYELVYNYYLPSGFQTKSIGNILVKNTVSLPYSMDFSFEKYNEYVCAVYDDNQYKLLMMINNKLARMSPPMFKLKVYDSDLNLISVVELDGVLIDSGTNVIEVPIPDEIVKNKGEYYFVVSVLTPSESMYSEVIIVNTEKLDTESCESRNMSDIVYMIYPTQYYAQWPDVLYYDTEKTVNLKVPIIVVYPSRGENITVTVTDMFSNEYSVVLDKALNLRVDSTHIIPVFAGFVEVSDVPLTNNYVLSVKLGDNTEVKGAVNLFNIYYSGVYLNGLFNDEIVSAPDKNNIINSPDLYAYFVIASMRRITTPMSTTDAIYNILGNKILFNKEDVTISDGNIVINVLNGVAGKIMNNMLVSYLYTVQEITKNIRIIVAQNENPVWRTELPVEAEFKNGKIIINAPYIEKQKYVYLVMNDYIVPLNWIRNTPNFNDMGFDYTIYTYLDQKLGITNENDLKSITLMVSKDNPIAETIITTKGYYVQEFLKLITTINEEDFSSSKTITFLIGMDKPITTARLVVNEKEVTQTYIQSIPNLDFYLVKVMTYADSFKEATKSTLFNDIVNGTKIIELQVEDKTYYNIVPIITTGESYLYPSYWSFLVSGENVLVHFNTTGDTAVIKCDGTPIDIITYTTNQQYGKGVVYEYSKECKLSVQSNLFGDVQIVR